MSTPQVRLSVTSRVECRVPSQTTTSVAGTKTTVASQSGGLSQRSTSPIATESKR